VQLPGHAVCRRGHEGVPAKVGARSYGSRAAAGAVAPDGPLSDNSFPLIHEEGEIHGCCRRVRRGSGRGKRRRRRRERRSGRWALQRASKVRVFGRALSLCALRRHHAIRGLLFARSAPTLLVPRAPAFRGELRWSLFICLVLHSKDWWGAFVGPVLQSELWWRHVLKSRFRSELLWLCVCLLQRACSKVINATR